MGAISDLNGVACSRAGIAGQIVVDTAPDGTVSLRCNAPDAPNANLAVTSLLASPSVAHDGQIVHYTVSVANAGPAMANATTLSLSVNPSSNGHQAAWITVPSGCTTSGSVAVCDLDEVAPSTVRDLVFAVDPDDADFFGTGYTLTATAVVTTTSPERDRSDNGRTATTTVVP